MPKTRKLNRLLQFEGRPTADEIDELIDVAVEIAERAMTHPRVLGLLMKLTRLGALKF
jgi:hypothetical protein